MENKKTKIKEIKSSNFSEKEDSIILNGHDCVSQLELQEKIVIKKDPLIDNFIEALKCFVLESGIDCDVNDPMSLFATVLQKMERDHFDCIELSRQNQMIATTLSNNPRLMIFLKELINETPLRVALAKSDLTEMQPDIDDEDYEAYNLAIAQGRERRNRAREQVRSRRERCDKCNQVAIEYYSEIEADDNQVEGFVKFLGQLIEKIYEADIDRDFLTVMWKAYNFDNEVRQARMDGVIEGKNQSIAAKRVNQTDGLPSFSSAAARKEGAAKEGYIERLMKQQFN